MYVYIYVYVYKYKHIYYTYILKYTYIHVVVCTYMFLCLRETILLLHLRELDLFHNLKNAYIYVYVCVYKYKQIYYTHILRYKYIHMAVCMYLYASMFTWDYFASRNLKNAGYVAFLLWFLELQCRVWTEKGNSYTHGWHCKTPNVMLHYSNDIGMVNHLT